MIDTRGWFNQQLFISLFFPLSIIEDKKTKYLLSQSSFQVGIDLLLQVAWASEAANPCVALPVLALVTTGR